MSTDHRAPIRKGICHQCGAWVRGRYVRAIETGSGGGAIVVTHDTGICPGPSRRTPATPRRHP